MGRTVRRGSRGIAILDTSRGAPQVKYVFDIGDTVERPNAKQPYLWELDEGNQDAVMEALADHHDVSADIGLEWQLESITRQLAGDGFQLPLKADVGRNVVVVGKGFHNRILIALVQLPKVGLLGIWALHGVPNVKDIFDLGRTPAGVQDSNAPGTPPNGAAHALIPHVEIRAGGGVRSLGVN